MAISLTKGGNLSLEKEAPSITQALVGLGWTPRSTTGEDFDLDASALLLTASGKVRSDADMCFYNQTSVAGGAVVHKGDNRTGSGEGDDEQIVVDLAKVPADIERVVFIVTIDKADERRQNFGQVSNAYVHVANATDGKEIGRYDLTEDSSTVSAMIFAELYRKNGGWSFRAVGQGYEGGLRALAVNYGVNVA